MYAFLYILYISYGTTFPAQYCFESARNAKRRQVEEKMEENVINRIFNALLMDMEFISLVRQDFLIFSLVLQFHIHQKALNILYIYIFNRKIKSKVRVKVFKALWLALFSYSDINIPKFLN
jgi:hypothetical protein